MHGEYDRRRPGHLLFSPFALHPDKRQPLSATTVPDFRRNGLDERAAQGGGASAGAEQRSEQGQGEATVVTTESADTLRKRSWVG